MGNLIMSFIMVGLVFVLFMYAALDEIFHYRKRIDEHFYKKFCEKNGYVYMTEKEREEHWRRVKFLIVK